LKEKNESLPLTWFLLFYFSLSEKNLLHVGFKNPFEFERRLMNLGGGCSFVCRPVQQRV
jgi:hypothetical protein